MVSVRVFQIAAPGILQRIKKFNNYNCFLNKTIKFKSQNCENFFKTDLLIASISFSCNLHGGPLCIIFSVD
jgi:hypothetical protein